MILKRGKTDLMPFTIMACQRVVLKRATNIPFQVVMRKAILEGA